jgi:hypothetical protein
VPYERVIEPPSIPDAFAGDDSASAQVVAAALLAIGLQLSGEQSIEPIGEAELGYFLDGIGGGPAARTMLSRESAQRLVDESGGGDPAQRPRLRAELVQRYTEDPTTELAAALFEVCLLHDDPLVQVAAASSYFDVATEVSRLLQVLVEHLLSDDLLVHQVAAAALGRIAPEHPALDNPWSTPSRGANAPSPLESSLIVHGTFARRELWWQPGGDFHGYILQNVRPDLYSLPDRFSWSGGYSAAARALGAQELVTWVAQRGGEPLDIFAHSHGGSVAMLATHAPMSVGTLVLLSVPVHWATYFPRFDVVRRCVSIRVRADLVILADRGGQRFHDPRIEEHVLPIWFDHSATHDPATWVSHNLATLV